MSIAQAMIGILTSRSVKTFVSNFFRNKPRPDSLALLAVIACNEKKSSGAARARLKPKINCATLASRVVRNK
jgi:hypothetical protein